MSRADADLALKLRVRRVLWAMGYHCPVEVAVSAYDYSQGSARRWDVTDIDVLGVKFDSDLSIRTVVVDCKSGQESSPNRLFWLRGLMDFFGADEGYFVKSFVHEHGRLVAPKLGIRTFDEGELATLEEMVGSKDVRVQVGDRPAYDRLHSLWGVAIPRGASPTEEQLALKRVYQYLNYRYWFVDEHRNVLNVVDALARLQQPLVVDDPRHRLLALVALSRFTVSLLRVARSAASQHVSDVPGQARAYVFGGATALRERQRFFELLNEVAPKKQTLEPAYFPDLVEVVNRLVRSARFARSIPRLLDAVIIEEVMGPDPKPAEEVLGAEWSLDALVLAKRVSDVFVSATGLDARIFQRLVAK